MLFTTTVTGSHALAASPAVRRLNKSAAPVIDVWMRHWNGEFQHRIAASYDVNPGRVNEVLKGHKHPGSEQAARARYKKSA